MSLEFAQTPSWYHARERVVDGFTKYLTNFSPILKVLKVPFDNHREFMGHVDFPKDIILRRILPKELTKEQLFAIFSEADASMSISFEETAWIDEMVNDILERQKEDRDDFASAEAHRDTAGLIGN
jgi:hypothetical protein